MAKKKAILAIRNHDTVNLDALYGMFERTIQIAEGIQWAWAERAKPACLKCIKVMRQFAKGEVTTDDVKFEFKTLTKLADEVAMDDRQTFAIYCLAEVAHAAAHLGHLTTAMARQGKANRIYESLQRGYVVFGLEGVHRLAAKVRSLQATRTSQPAKRGWDSEDAAELVGSRMR